jgi:dipeptidyl aminopeptidase/acylaminoacyl peptidase
MKENLTVKKKRKPFGMWTSPIGPGMVAQRLRLEDVQWDSDGRTLLWVEGRGDRGVLCSRLGDEGGRDLSGDLSVRAGVGYGGGEFTASNGQVVFADRGGQLHRRDLEHDQPHPITPPFGAVASPALSPDGRRLLYVYTDGKTDLLAMVDAQGVEWPVQAARGADFYMQPVWHPSDELIAWVEWDHPNMPWDGTRLMLADIAPINSTLNMKPEGVFTIPPLQNQRCLAGDNQTPVSQPQFSPDGRYLAYIISNGEWDDLVLYDIKRDEKRILLHGEGFAIIQPNWVQGMRFYGWSHDSRRIFYIRNARGFSELWSAQVEDGTEAQIDISPYTWIKQLSVSPVEDRLAFIASGPTAPARVVTWFENTVRVEKRSSPENVSPEYLPIPREISWPAPDGTRVCGLYYPPTNPAFESEGLPPAMVNIHGGPTSQSTSEFSAEIAYFTSRGYAWLEVNHRGSTGYGRSYQNMLRKRWGEVDTEDAAGAAGALKDQNLADYQRLVIKGGSAGGYTVLNALIHHPGVFKGGLCLYGVSNLFTVELDSHKFEEHYNDTMIGPLPGSADKYKAWSPVYHARNIRDSLAIFQGSIDRVVPPGQSEEILAVLRENHIPHFYRLYEGEGHGFRKSETILDFLAQVEHFLQQYVLFAP